MADGDPGEVLFEFTAIGRSMKVVAIHAASGTEVTVVAPANAARADLQRLAMQKLLAKMKASG
jgi:hypothetical protein